MPILPHTFPRPLIPLLLTAAKAAGATDIDASVIGQFTDPITQQTHTVQSQPLTFNVINNVINTEKLALNLQADQREAEIGDIVLFTIKFANHTDETLPRYSINTRLAQGFKLVEDSVQLDGISFHEVTNLGNGQFRFNFSNFAKGEPHTLHYAVRITASSKDGDSLTTAYASATRADTSTLYSASVQTKVRALKNGVLSDEGIIFGKVSFPAECASNEAHKLLPIGGVRIYLEDGRYAITDATGDYNFHAVKPGMHTVKLDKLTLPQGVGLQITSNQQLGDAYSQFAEIHNGDFKRADFSAECPHQDDGKIFAAVNKLNEKLNDTDVFVEGERKISPELIGPLVENETDATTPPRTEKNEKPWTSQTALKEITTEAVGKGAWLWPNTETSTDGHFMAALPLLSTKVTLYINGSAIPETQLGEQLADPDKKVQVASWYGIKLTEGQNTAEVRIKDAQGKETVALKSQFISPGKIASIEITPETDELPADGGISSIPIKLRLLDSSGNLAIGNHLLTLETSEGRWAEADIQKGIPGKQIKVSDGETTVHLRSSFRTGKLRIKVTADQASAEKKLTQTADMRPLIATGYLDITAHGGSNDAVTHEGKIFMKGKVKGNLHLTFAYDSTKHHDDAYNYSSWLQDENDDHYAPARGDGSIRDQDARSNSKTYLKLEKGQNSVLYGDYELDAISAGTDPQTAKLDLARDPRYLTGAVAHYGDRNTDVDIFTARQENHHFEELLPGNGTRMNFRVGQGDITPNSAIVELLVRDRNNPGLTISTTTLERVADYTLDDVSGNLQFHQVIPTLDENLNPIYVHISYDKENTDGEQPYTVSGIRVTRSITETLNAGSSYTVDHDPVNGHTLSGAYLDYQQNKNNRLSISAARMEHANGDESGDAYRLQATHRWSKDTSSSLTVAQADKGFTSYGAGIASDRRETRIEHTQTLDTDKKLKLEGIRTENISGHTMHQTLGAKLETHVGEWQLGGGIRHIEQQDETTANNHDTVLLAGKRSINVLGHKGHIAAEYEQDIRDPTYNHLTASSEVSMGKSTSVYAKYDTGNDMLGTAGLQETQRHDTLKLGTKTRIKQNTELYSEYRSESLFSDTNTIDAETATGIKSRYVIDKQLTISPALEVVKVKAGDVLEDATNTSITINDQRNKERQKYLQLENRNGDKHDYYGVTGKYIAKMGEDWTGVIREKLYKESSATGASFDNTLTLGAARRPADNGKLNSQYMYQWKKNNTTGDLASKRNTHIFSTWQNYRVTNKTSVNGRLAGKIQNQNSLGVQVKTRTTLVDANVNIALTDKVDAELHGGVMRSEGGESRYSAGAGVNVNVADDWRVGVGYNAKGFEDQDLDPGKQNAAGPYLRLQGKIGESMFKSIQPADSSPDHNKLL